MPLRLNGHSATLRASRTPIALWKVQRVDESQKQKNVQLDLNNEVFQQNWLELDKQERNRVTDSLRKIRQLTWDQVYRDPGLKWERIASVRPPPGIEAIYSLRISDGRRATAYRDGNFMRFQTIAPDQMRLTERSRIGP